MRAPLSPLALCLSLAAWAGLQALLPPADAAPEVFHADLFGFPIISTIGSFLTRLLRNDPGSTGATVGRAIVNLQSDLGTLGDSLKDFVGEMRDWLGTLVKLLDRLRDSALVPLVKWLREKMKWLKDWLRRTFGPLLKILKTIRARVLDVYTRFIRPILDVIDVVRFFLQTLKRLGVEWAGELDARLGKIENAIVSNFQALLAHLNRVIDVVDSVITLELLFQRVPFLRTLLRDVNSVWNLTLASRMGIGGDSAAEVRQSSGTLKTPNESVQAFDLYLANGGGDFRASIAEWHAWLEARLTSDRAST